MKRFRCITADAPWPFRDKLPGPARGASKHYPCMSIEELCMLELPPLEDDCVLFLWRVAAIQREAVLVAEAWGFEVKSEIVWCKVNAAGEPRIGMGRTVRNAHESALICTRGRPVIRDRSIPSWFTAPRLQHSEKPEAFYRIVERLVDGPYVELFARRHRRGWTCIGDELEGEAAE